MEEHNGVQSSILGAPSGDGGLRSLGERFQPDLLRGTGGYEVPLTVPAGPGESRPDLSLRYSTGLGNGPFGMGWQLNGLFEIRRRTDAGVPAYDGTDGFQLADGDVLVDVGGGRYRPRVDTRFLDIRRVENDGDGPSEGDAGWRIRTKEGTSYELGTTPDSRIEHDGQVFAWLLARQTTPRGAPIEFRYEGDGGVQYLRTVSWGGFSLRFEYEGRPDILHDGRAGVERTTARRCRTIDLHREGHERPVSTYGLHYVEAPPTRLSLLESVDRTGRTGDGASERHPPVRMTYATYDPDDATYRRVGDRGDLPALDDPGTALVDMTGDGLPDILETDGEEHRYWPNHGEGRFGTPRPLPGTPAGMTLGERGVSFADLNGDGAADLISAGSRMTLSVANTGAGAWAERPTVQRDQLPLSPAGAATRLVDLDGDGRVDLLQSGPDGLLLAYNEGNGEWSRPHAVRRRVDDDTFPDVALDADAVHVTDMTGDGLSDLVTVENGRVTYWPSFGRGRWGERVEMARPPRFPRPFEQDRLFLSDVDGDGTADVVYVEYDRVSVWFNRAGNGWSDPVEIPFVPPPTVESVVLCDLNGTGTRGLLWSDARRRDIRSTYRYLDFTDGRKPYLLERVDNGFGLETRIGYEPTAAIRTLNGNVGDRPYLPFPVHVVSEIDEIERVTGRTRRTRLAFDRGYYDPEFGEFRGFERVSVTAEGDENTPTIVQETRFALGARAAPLRDAPTSAEARARERALAGVPAEVRTHEVREGTRTQIQLATTEWELRTAFTDAERGEFVHVPRMARGVSTDADREGPDRIETTTYEYDEYGNLTARRRARRFDDQPESEALVTDERFTYTTNEEAWLVGLPASVEERDADGRLVRHVRHYYDGPDFEGLPAGEVTQGRLRRTRELFLADWALPGGYADEIETEWGLVHEEGGFYRDTAAFAHDDLGNVTEVENGLGATRTIEYDDEGLFPVKQTTPDGGVTEVTFDDRLAGPTVVRTPAGAEIRYEYTPLGRLRAQYETVEEESELTRVLLARELERSPEGTVPAHLITIRPTTAGRSVEEFVDTELDAVADATVAIEYYDGEGSPIQQVRRAADAEDGTARWVVARRRDYDTQGAPAAEYPNVFVDGPGYRPDLATDAAVEFTYGPGGVLRRLTLADGRRLLAAYHPSYVEKWTPSRTDDDQPRVDRLDARGNLVGVEQPDDEGEVVTTAYDVDSNGRPTAITVPGGRTVSNYTYAGPGPAIRIDHADAGTRTYWYDAEERLRCRTDDLGRRLEYDYDAVGRPTTVTDASDSSNPVVLRELRYDRGRVVQAREGEVTTRYEHDTAGRPVRTTVEFPDGETLSVEREFGLTGELRAETTPDGTVEYTYGAGGAVRSILGIVDAIHVDESDVPTRLEFAGGDAPGVRYEYDPGTRDLTAAEMTTAGGGTSADGGDAGSVEGIVRRLDYGYDPDGNVAEIRDRSPEGTDVRTFEYDARSQLTRAITRRDMGTGATPTPDRHSSEGEESGSETSDTSGLVRDDRYDYSSAGDLTRNDESLTATGYDPDHAGRLTEVTFVGDDDPTTIEYDAAGRTVAIGDRTFRYDPFDRLIGATLEDGTELAFVYDHRGNRVEKRAGERRTRSMESYEVGQDGSRTLIRIGDLPVAERLTSAEGVTTVFAILSDGLGSTLTARALDGSATYNLVYSPYGLVRPLGEQESSVVGGDDSAGDMTGGIARGQGTDEVARFVGRRPDAELGVLIFGDRPYAPRLGRFLTPDWYVIERPERATGHPIALNAYAYAGNNPITFRDPSGRFLVTALIAIGAAFVVGFTAGAIVGAASGKSFGESLLMGLETGLLFSAGIALGAVTGGLAGGLLFGAGGLLVGAIVGGTIGGLNGLIGGLTQNYSLDGLGALSFLLDSTWGLVGTGLGLLFHGINLFYGDAGYNWQLSRRQNRHVYDGGFSFGDGYSTTQGNVISNLRGQHGELLEHEMLHVWQSRGFGPIFQAVYVGWLVVGGVVGALVGIGTAIAGTQSWGDTVKDFAYHNNPWEIWAYYQEGPGTARPGRKGDFSIV